MMTGILAVLFALASPAGPAVAAVPDGTRISESVLRPLADWVEKAMNVRITVLPITVASGIRLKTSLGLKGTEQAHVISVYMPGRILINNVIWDLDSAAAKSYLIHELVHHAQLLSGHTYRCHAAKEQEAYTLQNVWLAEQGESPLTNPEWIDHMSQC